MQNNFNISAAKAFLKRKRKPGACVSTPKL
jgi:hypothetical protein